MVIDAPRPVPGYAPGELWSAFDEAARYAHALPVAVAPQHLDGLMDRYAHARAWSDDPRAWREDAEGGTWLMDGMWDLPHGPTPPTDEEAMQPIVEAAMRSIGMNVPLRPIIPTIMRGLRRHG